jgi:hypothetical protein
MGRKHELMNRAPALLVAIIAMGCGGTNSAMPETEPILVDMAIDDVNGEGVVDVTPLQSSNLTTIYYFFKAFGERPPTVDGELYFSSSNPTSYRSLGFVLPGKGDLAVGKVFTLDPTALTYYVTLDQIPFDGLNPPSAQWGRTNGTATVTSLTGDTVTFTIDAVTTEAAPIELKPIRLTGTITIDFERQENVIPPF